MPCLGTTLVDLLTGDASHTDTYLLLCDVLSLPLQWHSAVKHRGMEESPSKGPRGPRAAPRSVHLRSTWRLIAAKYIPTLCADSSASPPHGDDKDDDEEATPEEETMPEA